MSTGNKFDLPTQYEINKIEIDGVSVIGLLLGLSLYESIYSPTITGNIQLLDTDTANIIENNEIEGVEEIKFEFTNALGEVLSFDGYLNGLTNRTIKNQKIMYNFDFHSGTMRKNEGVFITNRFDNKKPEDIAKEMIQKLGGQEDQVVSKGLPMNFLGSRKRPTEVMKYVLTHGVTEKAPSATDNGKEQQETSKGTTGFLFWQTLNGYRFASVDDVLKGESLQTWGPFTMQLQNYSVPLEDSMNGVIEHDFKVMGDFQSKLRGGAFKNTYITMDIDKGLYKEITYEDESNMTEKQKKAVSEFDTQATRYFWRAYSNERFQLDCEKAPENVWDQSKQFQSQNTVRQNTFNDQNGDITLPPRFYIRAGDKIELKFPKITEGEKSGEYDQKHSGHYVIKIIGHHFLNDGRAYSRVGIVRSTIQQDDASSEKT